MTTDSIPYEPTGLVQYEAARHALQECVRVDEAKTILDKVEALRVYAKQQNDSDMERWLAELKIRARRKLGEISSQLEKVTPKEKGNRAHSVSDTADANSKTKTLKDAGIHPRLAQRCEKLLEIDESEFEAVILDAKEHNKPVTYAAVESVVKKKQNQKEVKNRAAKEVTESQEVKHIKASVILADCLNILPDLQPIDLLIADPPYFTDGDFTKHISACLKKVKPTGQAYIFASADSNEIAVNIAIDSGHMILEQILVWNYNNTGQRQPNNRYTSNYQIAFYYRGVDAPDINKPADGKEQYSCQTINAPDARIGDRYHKWQKPIDLIKRLIRNSSNEGDFIFDPFVGSGTTVVAAAMLGRNSIGCDIDPEAIAICVDRGCVNE